MPSKDYLMLRSAQKACLEARTASLQLVFLFVGQFPDSLFRGNDGYENESARFRNWITASRRSDWFFRLLRNRASDAGLASCNLWLSDM